MATPTVIHITTADIALRYLLLNLMRYQLDAGFNVAAISSPGPFVPELEAAGIRHYPVPFTRRMTPLRDAAAFGAIYKILRRAKPDVVHTHTPKPGLYGQLAARLAGVPAIVNTIHGFYFHENMSLPGRAVYSGLERIASTCSDVMFFQSREDVGTARRMRIGSPAKHKHLGTGVDVLHFDPSLVDREVLRRKRAELRLPESVKVVGFVGRLVREKGVADLLQAAAIVRRQRPDVRFLFVGLVDEVKADAITPETAAGYGVGDVCVFPGLRNDMRDMYALMDVFVLPSYREGLPRAPMEALSMGVPCVVTNIRGSREIVTDGENGAIVPLAAPDRLAEAIIDSLDTPGEVSESALREQAVREFDERNAFRLIVDTYRELLSRMSRS